MPTEVIAVAFEGSRGSGGNAPMNLVGL